MRRQELGLAELAGPGADHLGGREVATVDDFQRGNGLVLEALAAAAIIGQRHQRGQHRQVAHIGAEIALQAPERRDDRRRHAIVLLSAGECRRMHLDMLLAVLHPVDRRHAAGEFGEQLAEYALAAVAVDDALVVGEVGRCCGDGALRHAFGHGALLQLGEKAVEALAVMTGGGAHRGRRLRSGRSRLRRHLRRRADNQHEGGRERAEGHAQGSRRASHPVSPMAV